MIDDFKTEEDGRPGKAGAANEVGGGRAAIEGLHGGSPEGPGGNAEEDLCRSHEKRARDEGAEDPNYRKANRKSADS